MKIEVKNITFVPVIVSGHRSSEIPFLTLLAQACFVICDGSLKNRSKEDPFSPANFRTKNNKIPMRATCNL